MIPCAKAARTTREDGKTLLETAQPLGCLLQPGQGEKPKNHALTLVAIVRGDVSVPV